MSQPTDILVEEHDVILHMIKILNKSCEKLEQGGDVPAEFFDKAIDFIRTFADKCHHGKEEDILFKLMENKGIPVEGGPIGVMLSEHSQGRRYVTKLADAVDRLKDGDQSATAEIIENARGYADLLAAHIDKENNILYPMGNQVFSADDQKYLQKEFDRVEQEMGEGVHEKYHHLVEELEKQIS